MSTRSRIGIQLNDGSVVSAYHHWDGYPEWLGRILNTHYNDVELVTELIDGGDMSCAWTDERWNTQTTQLNPYVQLANSGEKVQEYGPNYYSYRGEDCPPRYDDTLEEYLSDGEEYAYLYTQDCEWVCYDLHESRPKQVEIPSAALHV